MREEIRNGVRTWIPEDPNDKALLAAAEGATFGSTTFPSGWRSPEGQQVCRNGVLVDVA